MKLIATGHAMHYHNMTMQLPWLASPLELPDEV